MDELTASEESETREPLKRSLRRSTTQLLFVFVIYVLSAGPMYWYCYSAYHLRGSTFLAKLYLPLVVVSHVPFVSDILD